MEPFFGWQNPVQIKGSNFLRISTVVRDRYMDYHETPYFSILVFRQMFTFCKHRLNGTL